MRCLWRMGAALSVPLDPADKQAHVKSNKGDDSSEGAGIKRDEAHQLHRLELLRAYDLLQQ